MPAEVRTCRRHRGSGRASGSSMMMGRGREKGRVKKKRECQRASESGRAQSAEHAARFLFHLNAHPRLQPPYGAYHLHPDSRGTCGVASEKRGACGVRRSPWGVALAGSRSPERECPSLMSSLPPPPPPVSHRPPRHTRHSPPPLLHSQDTSITPSTCALPPGALVEVALDAAEAGGEGEPCGVVLVRRPEQHAPAPARRPGGASDSPPAREVADWDLVVSGTVCPGRHLKW